VGQSCGAAWECCNYRCEKGKCCRGPGGDCNDASHCCSDKCVITGTPPGKCQ
jgi:hypothetical protein